MRHRSCKFLFTFLMSVIFGGSLSAGDVFVYKGTFRVRGSLDVANTFPPLVRGYLVIDFDTGEARAVTYLNKGGKKQFNSSSPFNMTRATLPNAKTATVIGYGSRTDTSVNDFNITAVVLRGTDVSVKVETDPTVRTDARPRIITGTGSSAGSETSTDGSFQLVNYNFVLNSALTIDANNNEKSVTTVANEISAALTEQGYELPPPPEM